ncbi:MAG: hypothetical protein ACOYK9_04780 [Chlamydiia bacterium]
MFAVIGGWAIFGWYAYKAVKTKEFKFIILSVFFALIQLVYWPFFFNVELILGLYGLSFAALMRIELYTKNKIDSAPFYILGFVLLGLCFFVNFLFKYYVGSR